MKWNNRMWFRAKCYLIAHFLLKNSSMWLVGRSRSVGCRAVTETGKRDWLTNCVIRRKLCARVCDTCPFPVNSDNSFTSQFNFGQAWNGFTLRLPFDFMIHGTNEHYSRLYGARMPVHWVYYQSINKYLSEWIIWKSNRSDTPHSAQEITGFVVIARKCTKHSWAAAEPNRMHVCLVQVICWLNSHVPTRRTL